MISTNKSSDSKMNRFQPNKTTQLRYRSDHVSGKIIDRRRLSWHKEQTNRLAVLAIQREKTKNQRGENILLLGESPPEVGSVFLLRMLFSYAHLWLGVMLLAPPTFFGLRGDSNSGLSPLRKGVLSGDGVSIPNELSPKSLLLLPSAALRCMVGDDVLASGEEALASGEEVRDGGVVLE